MSVNWTHGVRPGAFGLVGQFVMHNLIKARAIDFRLDS